MPHAFTVPSVLVATLVLSGCCAFVPCHPATALVGTVVSPEGTPVASAQINLYGSKLATNSGGCFKARLADALPFTFVVAAPGYKAVQVAAKSGFYRTSVVLFPEQAAQSSRVDWFLLSAKEYEEVSCQ